MLKFGLGALVDVEYSTQLLQVKLGASHTELQQPSIHNALTVLHTLGEISLEVAEMLEHAYLFFRKLINGLRMRRGNANDVTLPEENTWELEHLARRIGYVDKNISAGEQLIIDFDTISAQVYKFLLHYFEKNNNLIADQTIKNPAVLVFLDSAEKAKELLRPFENPEQALQKIKKCARTAKIQKTFSQLLLLGWIRIIRGGEPDLVLTTFSRVVDSFDDDRTLLFYEQLLNQPKALSVFIDLFSTSRFLSEEIIKNPEYIDHIINTAGTRKQQSLESYIEKFNNLKNKSIDTEVQEEKLRQQETIIRDFRKKEMLYITVRDICLHAPLPHICSEISFLAQTLIQQSLFFACEQLNMNAKGIAIFAFGKLGAFELNYSSDIDLICVYNDDCEYSITELEELFRTTTNYLSKYTEHGIAYRVDLRLRPYGVGSNIVSSIQQVQQYFSTQARLWEIQASLKLGFVAGDAATAQQCFKFLFETNKERLLRYNKQTLLSEIHKLRTTSVQVHTKNKETLYELKNSWGGIRDIEFGTQALQLLHYDQEILHLNTIQAQYKLAEKNIITAEERQTNIEHYLFLRKIEHFLQVYEDRQIHAIPEKNSNVVQRLSWFLLKELDEDLFINKLSKAKEETHNWYSGIFG